ncbi:MAG: response regulator, partial [Deltaproteobacteria bacterium]|nr:response regulator [Deltaproteobacteria bacterium]
MNQQLVKILLVDDDLQSLESTQRILEFSGYAVVTASNGQVALEQLRPTHEKPLSNFDVVLTDVRMPKLDGLELLKALSVCQSKVPVILMTAYGRIQDAVWA